MIRPLEPDGGSRLPWKSLNDSSWMSMVGPLGAADVLPPVKAAPVAASAATATTPDRRRVREEVIVRPCAEEKPAVAGFVHANRGSSAREDAWCNVLRALDSRAPRR